MLLFWFQPTHATFFPPAFRSFQSVFESTDRYIENHTAGHLWGQIVSIFSAKNVGFGSSSEKLQRGIIDMETWSPPTRNRGVSSFQPAKIDFCLGSMFQQVTNIPWVWPPPRMPVTTRIITFLVGNPHKPSFPTVTGRVATPKTYQIWGGHLFSSYHVKFQGCSCWECFPNEG